MTTGMQSLPLCRSTTPVDCRDPRAAHRIAMQMSTRTVGWSVLIRCFLVMLALIVAACGGASAPPLADAGNPPDVGSAPDVGNQPDADPPGAALVRIEVTPPNARVPAGFTQQLVAIGVFSDSTTNDVTSKVTWRSGREETATVSAAGVVTAVAVGAVAITAQMGTLAGTVAVTVTDAELVSIAVTPSNPTLPKGQTQQLTATGTCTDRSTRELARSVTWASSAPQFVRVSNDLGSQGVATAAAVGTASITATLIGKTGDATVR